MRKRYFIIPLTAIIIAGVLVWACKNPHGVGIDFSGLVDYIPKSQRAPGPGYTNDITYGDNIVIDPTKNTSKSDKEIKIFSPSGNSQYRIPALLALQNGDILAFADKRQSGSGDLPNQIQVVVKISTNNGTNWEQEKPVTPVSSSQLDGHGDTAVVQDRKTGDVLAVVAFEKGFLESTPEKPIRIRVMRSKDNGRNWSGPVDITSQIYGRGCKDATRRNWYAAFVSSGNGLQMRNGRIMFVLNVRETQSSNANSFKNYIMYSDDGGYRWKVSSGSPKNPKGGNEAKVVELNDESLLMHIRWTPYRLQSRSYDKGETWTDATEVKDIPASSSNGDLIVYTSTKNGYDKDRLITLVDSGPWNGDAKPPKNGQPRDPVFYVSYDEGKTWNYNKKLFSGNAGYSSLTILKDGSIGILAELTQPWNGPIWFLKASIEWVNPEDNPTSPTNTTKK